MASRRSVAACHHRSRAPCAPARKDAESSTSDERLEEKVAAQVRYQLDLAKRNLRRGRPSLREIIYIVLNFILIVCSRESVKALKFTVYYVLQCLYMSRHRNVKDLPHLCNDIGLFPPSVSAITVSTQTEAQQNEHRYAQATPTTASSESQTNSNEYNEMHIQTDDSMDNVDKCPVCMERPIICLAYCGHAFCGQCIHTQYSLTADHRCPECRESIGTLIPLPGIMRSEIQQLPMQFEECLNIVPDPSNNTDSDDHENDMEFEELPDIWPRNTPTENDLRVNDLRVFPADIYSYEGEVPIDFRLIRRYFRVLDPMHFRCSLCDAQIRNQVVILTEHLDSAHREEAQRYLSDLEPFSMLN